MAKLLLLFALLSTALITRYVSAQRVTEQNILASCYYGAIGNRDNRLDDGGYYYAELSKNPSKKDFKALNGLPNGHRLRITYKNKSIIATKGDVGAGGDHKAKIDIHFTAAKALGFTSCKQFGIQTVTIKSV